MIAVVFGGCSGGSAPIEVATLESMSVGLDDASAAPSLGPTAEEAALLFAECMRENGVDDFADPVGGDQDKVDTGSKGDADRNEVEAAYQACKGLNKGATKEKGPDGAGEQDQLYELAVCMRANGFDMPDPHPSGDPYADLDKTDPGFLDALEGCEYVFSSPAGGKSEDTGSDL